MVCWLRRRTTLVRMHRAFFSMRPNTVANQEFAMSVYGALYLSDVYSKLPVDHTKFNTNNLYQLPGGASSSHIVAVLLCGRSLPSQTVRQNHAELEFNRSAHDSSIIKESFPKPFYSFTRKSPFAQQAAHTRVACIDEPRATHHREWHSVRKSSLLHKRINDENTEAAASEPSEPRTFSSS